MKAEEKVQTLGEAEEPCLQTRGLPFKYTFYKMPIKEKWIENYLQALEKRWWADYRGALMAGGR